MIYLFLFVVAIQLVYAFFFLWGLRKTRQQTSETPPSGRQFVSIIICAKNEEENLTNHLEYWLGLDYYGSDGSMLYEVIVVDDCSEDHTPMMLRNLSVSYPQIKVLTIIPGSAEDIQGKKAAIAKAVAAARGEWLLFTDADCRVSHRWVSLMTRPLAAGKEIVAGYGAYEPVAGFLNKFIRAETIHTFIQYNAYTQVGMPYMAVGRNMACTKEIMNRVIHDERWSVIPSGDDDLLVSIAGTSHNMAVVCDPDSFTWSSAKATWKEWVRQKQRHLSTGKYYGTGVKLLLGLYGVSQALVWVCLLLLVLFHRSDWWFIAGLAFFMYRVLVFRILWSIAKKLLDEKGFVFFFPVFDLGWLIYNFAFSPYILWKNKTSWK